jgi:hypothetical protein
MLRITSTVLWALLPVPALAAATSEDELFLALFFGPLAYLLASVPAAGAGYMLGSFLKAATSVLLLTGLALIPIIVLWLARGVGQAVQLAPASFGILLLLGPLIFLGWSFGHRDAIEHAARDTLLKNGS